MRYLTHILPESGCRYSDQVLGAPRLAGAPHNPDLDLIGWEVPQFLKHLYRIHHGLGPHARGWLPYALLPWPEVVALTARVRFGEENICWDPADCILFCRDATGGGWVFQDRDAPVLRYFDGATHRLSIPLEPRRALATIVAHWTPDEP